MNSIYWNYILILLKKESDMKNVKTLLIAIAATTALPLSAAQYVFVAGNDSLETKVCIAAAENDLGKYKKATRALSLNKSIHKTVANDLSCNDQSLVGFARRYNADKTAKFVGRYTKHDVIIKREISDANSSAKSDSLEDDKIVYVTVN